MLVTKTFIYLTIEQIIYSEGREMYLLTNSVQLSFFLLLFVESLQVLDQSHQTELRKCYWNFVGHLFKPKS